MGVAKGVLEGCWLRNFAPKNFPFIKETIVFVTMLMSFTFQEIQFNNSTQDEFKWIFTLFGENITKG